LAQSPGDTVAKGEMLMEVETDKANVEVEAPHQHFVGGDRAARRRDSRRTGDCGALVTAGDGRKREGGME